MVVAEAYEGGRAANNGNSSPFNWNYNGKTWSGIGIGFGLGTAAALGVVYIGPYISSALYSTGIFGSGMYSGLAASAIGYGVTGAFFMFGSGFGTGYLTDLYVNDASSADALVAGMKYAWIGAEEGFVLGLGYGFTKYAYNRAYGFTPEGCHPFNQPVAYGQIVNPFSYLVSTDSKVSSEWVDRTYWSSSAASTSPIPNGTKYFLPPPPSWYGKPDYEGPSATPNDAFIPNNWFKSDGKPVDVGSNNKWEVPWNGWVDQPFSDGPLNISVVYRQRIYHNSKVLKLFGFLTLWKIK